MSTVTISELCKQKPLEPILEREIQIRAYEIYMERGAQPGRALQDWVQAEAEVMSRAFGPTGRHGAATEFIRGLPYPCV
jgi:hypothetical protein